MHQRGDLLAAGALAARVTVVAVLAAKVLQVGPCQGRRLLGLAEQHLGMAHPSAVDYGSEAIDDISLSYNIFKLYLA